MVPALLAAIAMVFTGLVGGGAAALADSDGDGPQSVGATPGVEGTRNPGEVPQSSVATPESGTLAESDVAATSSMKMDSPGLDAPAAEDGSTCTDGRDIAAVLGASGILTGGEFSTAAGDDVDTSKSVTVLDGFRLAFTWALPDDLREQMLPCDYFTFTLPDGFVPNTPQSGPFTDEAGDVVGQYTVDADGNARLTFGDYITTHADVDGDLDIQARVDQDWIDAHPGEGIPTPFPGEGDNPTIPVEQDDDNNISKAATSLRNGEPLNWDGRWAAGKVQDYPFEWEVIVNNAGRTMPDPVLAETYPKTVTVPDDITKFLLEEGYWDAANQQFIAENVLYDYLKDLGRPGQPVTGELPPDPARVDLPDGTRKTYRLTVQTRIWPDDLGAYADASAGPDGTVVPEAIIPNKATLDTGNLEPFTADAEQKYTYQATIAKKQTSYDPATGVMGWKVTYKHGSKFALPAGYTMNDTANASGFTDADGKPLSMAELSALYTQQAKVPITVKAGTLAADAPAGSTSIDLVFAEPLKQDFTLTYYTKIADPTQSVTVAGNSFTSGNKSKTTKPRPLGGGIKSLAPGDNQGKAVDMKARTATWDILVNQGRKTVSKWSLEDTISGGTVDVNPTVTVVDLDAPDRTLVQGQDYVVTTGYASELRNKMTVTMNGIPAEFQDHAYKVTYTSNINYSLQNGMPEEVLNYALINYPTVEGGTSEEGTDSFYPRDFGEVGITKTGEWDARLGTANWTVTIPEQDTPFGPEAGVVDPLQHNWKLVPGTVQVTGPDGQPAAGIAVDHTTEQSGCADKSPCEFLRFTGFPEGETGPYVITFKTTLPVSVDQYGEYFNKGWVSNTAYYYDKIHEPSKGTKGLNYNRDYSLLGKTGTLGEDGVLSYKVTFNSAPASAPAPKDVTIKDAPFGMELRTDTFKLVEKGGAADLCGTGGITCKVMPDGYTVFLPGEVTKTYVITYDATALVEGQEVVNNVTAKGEGIGNNTGNTRSKVLVPRGQSSASARGGVYGFLFSKVDQDGEPLPGAEFTLERLVAGNPAAADAQWEVRSVQDSADNGDVAFNNLTPGTFRVTETGVPDGYVVTPSQRQFTVVLSSKDGPLLDDKCDTVTGPGAKTVKQGVVTVTDADGNPVEITGYDRAAADGFVACEVDDPADSYVLASNDKANFTFVFNGDVKNSKIQPYSGNFGFGIYKTLTGDVPAGFDETFQFQVTYTGDAALLDAMSFGGGAGFDATTRMAPFTPKARMTAAGAGVPATVDGSASGDLLPPLEFAKEGTYTFEVTEVPGSNPGIAYDPSIFKVTVPIVLDGNRLVVDPDGLMINDSHVEPGPDGKYPPVTTMTFTNDYRPAPTTFNARVTKGLKLGTEVSDAPDQEFAFAFNQEKGPRGGATMEGQVAMPGQMVSDTATLSADDVDRKSDTSTMIPFGTVTLDRAGTYVFKITEVTTDVPDGWIYDPVPITATVTVVDDGLGKLSVPAEGGVVYTRSGKPVDAAGFVNTFVGPGVPPPPPVTTPPTTPVTTPPPNSTPPGTTPPPSTAPGSPRMATTASNRSTLARTGAQVAAAGAGVVVLLGAGCLLIGAARRRDRSA